MKEMLSNAYFNKLSKVLGQRCDGWITRSGNEASSVNCYSIYLMLDDGVRVYVNNIENGIVHYTRFDGTTGEAGMDSEILVRLTDSFSYDVIHYIGLHEARYKGLRDLYFSDLLFLPKLQRLKIKYFGKINQWIFNLRKLSSFERLNVLKDINEYNRMKQDVTGVTTFLLYKYEHRWFNHPRKNELIRDTEYQLKSLIETKELKLVDRKYRLTGEGILAISNFDEDERKHKDSTRLQFWLVILTIVLAFGSLIEVWEFFSNLGSNSAESCFQSELNGQGIKNTCSDN